MLAIIMLGAILLILGGAWGLYRLAFMRGPDLMSPGRELPHLADRPGYELSGYENAMRAFRARSKERAS
jgi:hypothetical protein